jgi:hypothetical protein
VLAFERGERQQVIDEPLHVLRLFLHQRDVALLLEDGFYLPLERCA